MNLSGPDRTEMASFYDSACFVEIDPQEFPSPPELMKFGSDPEPLVPIFDAEMDLVCLAPRSKADLLARIINAYDILAPPADAL